MRGSVCQRLPDAFSWGHRAAATVAGEMTTDQSAVVYLASPDSHPDAAVREARFQAACHAAAELMRAGHLVFSPVAHSHSIAAWGLPTDWCFWERCDRELLSRCDAVIVLTLDGWEQSRGVQAEIEIARALGKPVQSLAPIRPTPPLLAPVAKEAAF